MRVSKAHPVANWLRVDGDTYSRSLDQVLKHRDEQLLSDPQASGLPPASAQWFWLEQLPRLCGNPEIKRQVEERIAELAAKREALTEQIRQFERGVQAERYEVDAELASLQQVIR